MVVSAAEADRGASAAELLARLESLLEVICAGTEPEPPGVLAQHARVACRHLRYQLEQLAIISLPAPAKDPHSDAEPYGYVDLGTGPLETPERGAVSALGLEVDIDGCRAVLGGRSVELNRAETILAAYLVGNAGRAVPYELLQRAVWQAGGATLVRLRAAVSDMRTRLGLSDVGLAVQAVTGIGYRLVAVSDET